MSDFRTRKQYRIDARKYHKLLENIGIIALKIDMLFCVCDEAFTKIGRVDPRCQAHDISQFVFDFIEKEKVVSDG